LSISEQSVAAFKEHGHAKVEEAGTDKRGPAAGLSAGDYLERPVQHCPETAGMKDPESWKGTADQ